MTGGVPSLGKSSSSFDNAGVARRWFNGAAGETSGNRCDCHRSERDLNIILRYDSLRTGNSYVSGIVVLLNGEPLLSREVLLNSETLLAGPDWKLF